MEPERPVEISVIEPVGPAFEKMREVLFRPFDLGKWFVIGFCAWLAKLGERGFSFSFHHGQNETNLQHFSQQAKDFTLENLIWLSSRGRFMFLHCVARDTAEIKVPWQKFRRHANNLFVFRIVLGLISFAVVGLPVLVAVFLMVVTTNAFDRTPHIAHIVGLVMIFLIVLFIVIVFTLIWKFTTQFVVPIMFLRTTSCLAAWRQFLTILSARKGAFALYVLFRIVIGGAISVIICVVGVMTCCTTCCFLAIPYIGTVILLPVYVFLRAYSLFFLRQFGGEFDCFSTEVGENS